MSVPRPTCDIVNNDGRRFRVRVIPRGAKYGRSDGCEHNFTPSQLRFDPLVEFWDRDYAFATHEHGVFVQRYFLHNLKMWLDRYGVAGEETWKAGCNLPLQADTPEWIVSELNVREAIQLAEVAAQPDPMSWDAMEVAFAEVKTSLDRMVAENALDALEGYGECAMDEAIERYANDPLALQEETHLRPFVTRAFEMYRDNTWDMWHSTGEDRAALLEGVKSTIKRHETRTKENTMSSTDQKPERVAHIIIDTGRSSSLSLDLVQRYLPSNYEATEEITEDGEEVIQIRGRDDSGWTMDGYVIPRLASANVYAVEVTA